MHKLEVGKPYHPDGQVWPERSEYSFRLGGHELRIFLGGATRREVEAVRSGPVEFGFFAEPEGLLLIARFGSQLSFDCCFNWHRVAAEERTLPPPSEETSREPRASITIILVEATTGMVLALRGVTFSPEFTRALHRAIADQAGAPYDRAAHDRWSDGMVARHFADQLWAECTMRCRGGD
jgi:hypothetical protein